MHRLDRNTDGLLVFAKNEAAKEALLAGFRTHAFEKYYLAEVYGSFEKRAARSPIISSRTPKRRK